MNSVLLIILNLPAQNFITLPFFKRLYLSIWKQLSNRRPNEKHLIELNLNLRLLKYLKYIMKSFSLENRVHNLLIQKIVPLWLTLRVWSQRIQVLSNLKIKNLIIYGHNLSHLYFIVSQEPKYTQNKLHKMLKHN